MTPTPPNAPAPAPTTPGGEREALESENRELRKEVWLRHGCPLAALYGDDGEMQCNACMLDFKRQPVGQIVARLHENGMARARRTLASAPTTFHTTQVSATAGGHVLESSGCFVVTDADTADGLVARGMKREAAEEIMAYRQRLRERAARPGDATGGA